MGKQQMKYMDVDIIAVLEQRMKINTQHYQSDFEYDKEIIERSAQSDRKEDKTLIWMSRPMGTHCHREYDSFIEGTGANTTWRFYAEQGNDSIVAYAVELTGVKDGIVRGNLYELDYREFAAEITSKCVLPSELIKTFEDGFVVHVAPERSSYGYYINLVEEHGPIVDHFVIPQDKEQLSMVLSEQKRRRHKLSELKFEDPKVSLEEMISSAATRSAVQQSLPETKSKVLEGEKTL